MSAIDVLAIAPHPDDAEIGCGGSLALLAATGRRTAILNLTRGELGTRGTPELRRQEAETAAASLGVSHVQFEDFGDGGLRTGRAEEDRLIAALRRFKPAIVLAPPRSDRHPDHERANSLVRAACFYAGLEKRTCPGDLEKHRPAVLLEYMLHSSFEPTLVVDVSSVWDKKLQALEAYASQLSASRSEGPDLDGPAIDQHGPPTKIASGEFFASLIGRARHYGQLIGAEFGEPFLSERPLAVHDLFSFIPAGPV